jgi:hypothetical protein
LFQLDGNPIDMATIIVAVAACFIRPIRRKIRGTSPCFSYEKMVIDFLNGTVLVPFMLLVGAIFSRTLLEEAVKTNKLFFAIGGIIALFFVIREYFNGD